VSDSIVGKLTTELVDCQFGLMLSGEDIKDEGFVAAAINL
jgi:hypothetical protein